MTELETFPSDWYDVVDFDENNNPKITEQTCNKLMEKSKIAELEFLVLELEEAKKKVSNIENQILNLTQIGKKPFEIIREGGITIFVRMLVDGESRLYTRTQFPDFYPTWRYYPEDSEDTEYNSHDQVKLENLFQQYLKENNDD